MAESGGNGRVGGVLGSRLAQAIGRSEERPRVRPRPRARFEGATANALVIDEATEVAGAPTRPVETQSAAGSTRHRSTARLRQAAQKSAASASATSDRDLQTSQFRTPPTKPADGRRDDRYPARDSSADPDFASRGDTNSLQPEDANERLPLEPDVPDTASIVDLTRSAESYEPLLDRQEVGVELDGLRTIGLPPTETGFDDTPTPTSAPERLTGSTAPSEHSPAVEPDIVIRIGRIDVRPETQRPAASRHASTRSRPRRSLDDWLRTGGENP